MEKNVAGYGGNVDKTWMESWFLIDPVFCPEKTPSQPDRRAFHPRRAAGLSAFGVGDFLGVLDAQQTASMHRQFEAILDAGFLENMHQVNLYSSSGNR